jgi:putative ABC transport system ATP-binding protein
LAELVRTTGLQRQFRLGDTVVRAVDGIDLSVAEGEFVSIMGPSGCGKSTLLYLLGGLDQPTGGEIHVLQNVQLQGMLGGRPGGRAATRRWAMALLEDLGVGDKAKALPAVLSGGQRQRVAIARALMNEPPLLLADEPTGNLDSATTTDVLGLLRRFHAAGQTVVVVTHGPRVATTAAQRLLAMRDGRVVDDVRLDGGTGAARALQDLIER